MQMGTLQRVARPRFRRGSAMTFGGITVACTALVLAGGGALADSPAPSLTKPQDLTGLSLEELLHEDITPINVLGSHTHLQGGLMLGYRYMYMDMGHNQEGTRDVSDQEVLQRYPVVHTSMTMEMHMAELMYAPADWVTLMAMVPFKQNTMEHLTRTGERPVAKTSGLGDVGFMGLFNLLGDAHGKGQRLVLNAGFTAPTGSIDEGEGGQREEYSLQLGSGTFDLEPGLTYLGESESWSWGAQVMGVVRLGQNDHDYRLGDAYRVSAWAQYKVADWFGPSVRFDWRAWDDIHGADPELNPARNPAFDANLQSGERLDFLAGVNFYMPKGLLKGARLSVEGGVPVYQSLAGPNLAVDWLLTVGVSYTFR